MGFYSKQPVDPQKTTVTYVWTGLRTPGFFSVHVEGDARKFSTAFSLTRDAHFVGGLKIDVGGWTGPLAEGTSHYKVDGNFPGLYQKEIVISGSNGDFIIPVREIAHDKADEYFQSQAV